MRRFSRHVPSNRTVELTRIAKAWVDIYVEMHEATDQLLVLPDTPNPNHVVSHKEFFESALNSGKLLIATLEKENIILPSPFTIEELKGIFWKMDWDYKTWHSRTMSDEECDALLEKAFPSPGK